MRDFGVEDRRRDAARLVAGVDGVAWTGRELELGRIPRRRQVIVRECKVLERGDRRIGTGVGIASWDVEVVIAAEQEVVGCQRERCCVRGVGFGEKAIPAAVGDDGAGYARRLVMKAVLYLIGLFVFLRVERGKDEQSARVFRVAWMVEEDSVVRQGGGFARRKA